MDFLTPAAEKLVPFAPLVPTLAREVTGADSGDGDAQAATDLLEVRAALC